VLPYFRKSEGLAPNSEISVDRRAIPPARSAFLCATRYCRPRVNSSRRRSPQASHPATITDATAATPRGWCHSAKRRRGTASDRALFRRFLPASRSSGRTRPSSPERTKRVILAGPPGQGSAAGVEYRTASGETVTAHAAKEVILSAGVVGSLQFLPLSGIGPRQELDAVGVPCLVDSPHLGKHLRAHLRHTMSTSYCQQNHCPHRPAQSKPSETRSLLQFSAGSRPALAPGRRPRVRFSSHTIRERHLRR
jgi:choline dehydrogenase